MAGGVPIGVLAGARGGARGGGGLEVNAIDALFHRYFDGITLTPQQESDARTILSKWMADQRAVNPTPAPAIILRPPFSNKVIMSQESAAAFASFLTNDADRATLQSHITVDAAMPVERPPR